MPRLYLDTNVVIAIVERDQRLTNPQLALVNSLDQGRATAVTSELTLAECLVKPMAEKDIEAVSTYLSFLDDKASLRVIPIVRNILLIAAELRSEKGIKLADAIHCATAIDAQCDILITNDRQIKPWRNLVVEMWDQL